MTLYCRQPPGGDKKILVFWSCRGLSFKQSNLCLVCVTTELFKYSNNVYLHELKTNRFKSQILRDMSCSLRALFAFLLLKS